jgi:hypothetical protein
MEIKKTDEGVEIKLTNLKIAFEDLKSKTADIKILSKITPNINEANIINLPGEYEIKGIFFRGYQNQENIIFVFGNRETKVLYATTEPADNIQKNIKEEFDETIDIGIFKNIKNWQKLKNDLKLKVAILIGKVENFKGEKVKDLKLNIKKLEEKDYLLI